MIALLLNKKKSRRISRATKTRHILKKLKVIRLVVHRTSRHMYAQIISPISARVLVFASTVEKEITKIVNYTGNKNAAAVIGKLVAERAINKGINCVSFDRSGFRYHGRIKELANAARKAGLKF